MNVRHRAEAAAGLLNLTRAGEGASQLGRDPKPNSGQKTSADDCEVRPQRKEVEGTPAGPCSANPMPRAVGMRSASQTRVLALALQRAPLASFTKNLLSVGGALGLIPYEPSCATAS